jgi:hypothetical protein
VAGQAKLNRSRQAGAARRRKTWQFLRAAAQTREGLTKFVAPGLCARREAGRFA